jgi:hypothetical protein
VSSKDRAFLLCKFAVSSPNDWPLMGTLNPTKRHFFATLK